RSSFSRAKEACCSVLALTPIPLSSRTCVSGLVTMCLPRASRNPASIPYLAANRPSAVAETLWRWIGERILAAVKAPDDAPRTEPVIFDRPDREDVPATGPMGLDGLGREICSQAQPRAVAQCPLNQDRAVTQHLVLSGIALDASQTRDDLGLS